MVRIMKKLTVFLIGFFFTLVLGQQEFVNTITNNISGSYIFDSQEDEDGLYIYVISTNTNNLSYIQYFIDEAAENLDIKVFDAWERGEYDDSSFAIRKSYIEIPPV
jgi:hypothetical protein